MTTAKSTSEIALRTWDMNVVNNTNNSALTNDNIYVLIKGIDHDDDTKDVLVQYATEATKDTPKGSLVGYCHVDMDTKTEDYCYPLSLFNNLAVPLPLIRSGRIYFSFQDKMKMKMVEADDGRVTISDTNCFPTAMSPSIYTNFQNIEYTWLNIGNMDSDSNGTWINPTAVDFVSIPIHIQYNGSQGGLEVSRASILKSLTDAFANAPTHNNWNKLLVADQLLPDQTLRICSPGKAIILGSEDPEIVKREFSTTYLDEYIDAIWKYYQTSGKAILIDCKEIKNDPNNKKYKDYTIEELMIKVTVDKDGYLLLTNTPGINPAITERLEGSGGKSKPSTFAIFAGDGAVETDPFKVINDTLSALVIREICSAIDVGILPQKEDVQLNKDFYKSKREAGELYVDNDLTSPGGTAPWYDLYAATVHASAPDLYAYAFDDVLGMDGTCHGPRLPTSPVTVTLGDVSDIKFATKPPVDNDLYTVLVQTTPTMEIDIVSVPGKPHVDKKSNSGWLKNVKSPLVLMMHNTNSVGPLTIEVYLKKNAAGERVVLPPHTVTFDTIEGQGLAIGPSNDSWQ